MSNLQNIMKKNVVVVTSEITLPVLAKMLIENKLSGIPVVKDKKNQLVGFVSERDIITALSKDLLSQSNVTVKDIMNKKVVTVTEKDSFQKVAHIFTEQPFRYIPVVKEKKIVGILSRKDVISELMGHYY